MSENQAETDIDDDPSRNRMDGIITWAALGLIGLGILGFASRDQFFVRHHGHSPRTPCIANLKNIEGAKSTWALENRKETNAIPMDADLFGSTLYIREKPECPGGGTYTLGAVSEKPRCSIRDHTL